MHPALRKAFGPRLGILTCVGLLSGLVLPAPAPAALVTETLSFRPVADTYVKEAAPDTNYGTSSSLYVDRKDAKRAFLRFDVSALDGLEISNVRLRMYQRDLSISGGWVHAIGNDSWAETTMTWNTRPTAYEGSTPLATFGSVQKNQWYEVGLGPIAADDGFLSFALDSTSSDGVNWGSRQSATPPTLEVDVQQDDDVVVDGVSEIAPPNVGSSSPTYYATNHRMAVSENGRLLVVHGRHATGVQLAWRNPWGSWRTNSTGSVSDGLLLKGTGTGDWPASIVLADDSLGEQHAWVVWAGPSSGTIKALQMRRLSDLDAPSGPTVGPLVTIAPTGVTGESGNSKADIGFEQHPDGSQRGVITWLKRTGTSAYEYAYTWFDDLDTDTPAFHDSGSLFTYATGGFQGTLTTTPSGIAWVGRSPKSSLRVYRHAAVDPLDSWSSTSAGIGLSSKSYPSATTLDSGDIVAAVESDTGNHVVKVQRFTNAGPQPAQAFAGYRNPTIASDGTDVWLVMVREGDGLVVSRRFSNGSWSSEDRVELGPEHGGSHAWPNAVRTTDGRLRFVVEGPAGGATQNAVLAYQRDLAE